MLEKISHRVIRKLRRLGYLEAGIDVPVATGYDPLLDNEPELARSMAASVVQRIAFGERAGEKVRRIGSGFGYEGERPELKGPRCASVNGFSLHANTDVAAHRRDQLERLLRYTARGVVSLERLTQDANGELLYQFAPYWNWSRLLGRVYDLDMATWPFCQRGALRIIAAIFPPLRGRREPCDLHPGVGDYPNIASPKAGVRAATYCPCPLSPEEMLAFD